ncbi:MAG: SDR family NAD(P)-dependent oxidoreductase, partial [Actinomycetota bacterium]|nr:SDR family NAD(P)-dependent oxidoreductase [Actinomycetota bacterium]
PIRMLHAFLPVLQQAHDPVVINVSSGLAFVPLPITPTYSATKAAIHSFTDALRVQLDDTSVQVIELAPPLTRTALMGSENNERAMPLDDFLSETMALLETQPDAEQILVERVKRQRFAEANGTYAEVLAMQSGRN